MCNVFIYFYFLQTNTVDGDQHAHEDPSLNDYNALLFAVKNAIRSKRRFRNNWAGFRSNFHVNVPYSRRTFKDTFENNLECCNMNGKDKLRVKLTVDNVRSVFGENWNKFVDGDVQQRVIGRINMHYRFSIYDFFKVYT